MVRLPVHAPPGREQQGLRPVVVVAEPYRVGQLRFEMVYAAPLTTQYEAWVAADQNLYHLLFKGMGGLVRDSVVLLEHARGFDATRVTRYIGALSTEEYAPIRMRLERMFAFEGS